MLFRMTQTTIAKYSRVKPSRARGHRGALDVNTGMCILDHKGVGLATSEREGERVCMSWDASFGEGVDAVQRCLGVDTTSQEAKRQEREEALSEDHGSETGHCGARTSSERGNVKGHQRTLRPFESEL